VDIVTIQIKQLSTICQAYLQYMNYASLDQNIEKIKLRNKHPLFSIHIYQY